MNLFDLDKIEKSLLPFEKIKLFTDEGKSFTDAPDDLKERLEAQASRWMTYVHADYGDSYGEFKRNRNRCNFEDLYVNRRTAVVDFVFAELVNGTGKYIGKLCETLEMILSEETWIVPAHVGSIPKDLPEGMHGIELYSSETSSAVCLAYYYLKDKLTPELRERIPKIIRARTFDSYLLSDDYNWMGTKGQFVNNWNPWINTNVVFCAIACAENDEIFRRIVLRACALTENYVRSCPENCLCNEGIRYWHLSGACLFDFAEILYDLTGGKYDITASSDVHGACSYVTAVYDEYGNAANFADSSIDFYPDCPLLVRAGRRTKNSLLERIGLSLYDVSRVRTLNDNYYRQLKDVLTVAKGIEKCAPDYPETVFLKSLDIFTVRKDGFFLSVKGGNNGESHNHNDLGSFVLYRDGIPVFIDPGVDLYSGFSFSSFRYDLWYMNSDFHNLPTIKGEKQKAGGKYRVKPLETDGLSAQTEISGAYGIEGVSYRRKIGYKDGRIELCDSFDLTPNEVKLFFMLRDKPEISGNVLFYPCGTKITFKGVKNILLEEIDITGENPPDNFLADAPNRKFTRYSVLIPRLSVKQWNRTRLYRLVVTPDEKEVGMTVEKI